MSWRAVRLRERSDAGAFDPTAVHPTLLWVLIMRTRCGIFVVGFLLLTFLLATISAVAEGAREFHMPTGLVTDFTGTLSEADVTEILAAIESSRSKNQMDGHIIVALRTPEWYLDEYVKDYADFLQGQGQVSPSGWLLYVSTADRKFSLGVQDVAASSITEPRKQEIALIMSEKLEQGDVKGAIVDAVKAIGELDPPQGGKVKKGMRPEMLFFAGIAIIVVTLMARLRNQKRKTA